MHRNHAVLLLSGGLDSTTLMAWARNEGYAVHALSFRYGQRHDAEIEASQKIAEHFGAVQHLIADIDLRIFGGSALTSDIPVPKNRQLHGTPDIPVTYVPARNTIFLSYAVALAEVTGASEIFIGVNAVDYSGYPDCRPEFIDSFQAMARLATRAGTEGQIALNIRAPLIGMTKSDIIRMGLRLGVKYEMTMSCYDPAPSRGACGHCDACQLRLRGFLEAGSDDPAIYAALPDFYTVPRPLQ